MKLKRGFSNIGKGILSVAWAIVSVSLIMSAVLLPYRAFMKKTVSDECNVVAASISVLRPAGIAYDLECDLLARFISSLAEKEPYVCRVAIGATVVNRKVSVHFSDDIASVIYNFSPHFSENMLEAIPSDRTKHAARDALMGIDPSGGALYFCMRGKESELPAAKKSITANYGSYVFAK